SSMSPPTGAAVTQRTFHPKFRKEGVPAHPLSRQLFANSSRSRREMSRAIRSRITTRDPVRRPCMRATQSGHTGWMWGWRWAVAPDGAPAAFIRAMTPVLTNYDVPGKAHHLTSRRIDMMDPELPEVVVGMVSVPNDEMAGRIAKSLVENRLAACVQAFPI